MREEHTAEPGPEVLARLEALQRSRSGRLYVKVQVSAPCIDGWPESTTPLWLDGVLFEDHPEPGVVRWAEHQEFFSSDLTSWSPTLVVARGYVSPASGMGPLEGVFRQWDGTISSPVMGPPVRQ